MQSNQTNPTAKSFVRNRELRLAFLPLVLVCALVYPVRFQAQQLLDTRVANLLERGEQFLGAREFDQAIDDFKSVLAVEPALVQAHNDMGVAYVGKGDLDHAVAEFRECVRLEPRNADSWSNLGLRCCAAARQMRRFQP